MSGVQAPNLQRVLVRRLNAPGATSNYGHEGGSTLMRVP